MGAFGVVLGHCPGALRTLVVGVGVDAQQAKLFGHPTKIWAGTRRPLRARLTMGPMPEDLFFHQLLAGEDFAAGDQFATTMRNHVYVIGDSGTRRGLLVDPAYDVSAIWVGWPRPTSGWPGCWPPTTTPTMSVGTYLGSTSRAWSTCSSWPMFPVHVQKDEVAWVAEMTGVPVASLVATCDDDVVQVGSIGVRLLHTPGHTPGSQCIVVGDNLVTGDTLFIDGCGRTDLPGADPDAMYSSLQRLASLPGRLILWPGHHYSPASSAPLDEVRRTNYVLSRMSREDWLRAFS